MLQMQVLKKLFAPVDMTVGKPWKNIVLFSIPMIIGNIAQQLYNTADSIIVGRFVGDNALAAVGSASPILNLLLVLFMGSAYAAMQVSPTHVCLFIAAECFKVDIGALVRRNIPMILVFFAVTLAYTALLGVF